jgi:malonyl-CoA/methylmalonyl-CoA synthetase
MIKSLIQSWEYSKDDRILHFLPLYHMHGLMNKALCMLWAGGIIEFLPSAKPEVIWERLMLDSIHAKNDFPSQVRPLTLFMAVPTVYAKMLEHAKIMDSSMKQLAIDCMKDMRLMVSGSAALPDIIMDEWQVSYCLNAIFRCFLSDLSYCALLYFLFLPSSSFPSCFYSWFGRN